VIESTEKKSQGPRVVIAILLVGVIGAGLTWLRYTAQAPSTANAHLVSERLVLAKFPSNVARDIREGSKAVVTLQSSPGEPLEGFVQSWETEEAETRVLILLKEVPVGARAQMQCSVTVDTSVSLDAIKAD
jgi:multidrug resistance efflux pump